MAPEYNDIRFSTNSGGRGAYQPSDQQNRGGECEISAKTSREAASGYHVRRIERGILGQASKIREELEEFLDAEEQGCRIMALVELSDMLGAIKEYLKQQCPGVTFEDLLKMQHITERAFRNGHRR